MQALLIKGNMWVNKSDVTDEAIKAVAQYLLEHDEAMNFNYHSERYRLAVTQVESKEELEQ